MEIMAMPSKELLIFTKQIRHPEILKLYQDIKVKTRFCLLK
ncbi:hypothetical protein [Streptococcus sp. sy010]|nr:hypothetical protein [Streptococcus sp. sy010]